MGVAVSNTETLCHYWSPKHARPNFAEKVGQSIHLPCAFNQAVQLQDSQGSSSKPDSQSDRWLIFPSNPRLLIRSSFPIEKVPL